MRKSRKPKHFLQTPQYPGGKTAMVKFINENLKYPKKALESKVEGTVEAEYFINGLGNITSVNILKGIGSGCDEEVVRLIKLLAFEKAVNRGMKSSTRKTLNVNFKLPKKKTPTIKYNLVKEAPKKEEVVKKPLGYNITITYKK
ncbi:MAG: TonB family protein [Cyclobacteriaceae bacterium]|jgi:TonB family protein